MRIQIVLTDERGDKYEGNVMLSLVSHSHKSRPTKNQSAGRTYSALSFNPNPRAFMKKYGNGLGGPQRFAILLARLAKGDVHKEIALAELQKHWNSMKPLMGGPFNGAHPTRAKGNGWVDSPKRGFYVLSNSWKEALKYGND